MKSVFTKQELQEEIKKAETHLKTYHNRYYEIQKQLFFYQDELKAIETGAKQEREE